MKDKTSSWFITNCVSVCLHHCLFVDTVGISICIKRTVFASSKDVCQFFSKFSRRSLFIYLHDSPIWKVLSRLCVQESACPVSPSHSIPIYVFTICNRVYFLCCWWTFHVQLLIGIWLWIAYCHYSCFAIYTDIPVSTGFPSEIY